MNTHFKPTRLSSRLSAVRPSPTIPSRGLANELRRQGRCHRPVAGRAGFRYARSGQGGAKAAIRAGATKYTDVDGTPELKRAIVGSSDAKTGCLTMSADQRRYRRQQVLYKPCAPQLDAGDEVVIPCAYWVSYPDMVLLAGGQPVTGGLR